MIPEDDAELLLSDSDNKHHITGLPATWSTPQYTASLESLGQNSTTTSDTGSEVGRKPALDVRAWSPYLYGQNATNAATTMSRRACKTQHYGSESSDGEIEAIELSKQHSTRSANSIASSSGSFSITRPTFSRRPSESSYEEGSSAIPSSLRRPPPPPIKVPRLRNAGIAIDSGHRVTVSETDIPLQIPRPRYSSRRSDSQPNNDYVPLAMQSDHLNRSHQRCSLTHAVVDDGADYEPIERISNFDNAWDEQSRPIASTSRKSNYPLLKQMSISRHSREISLPAIQTASTTKTSLSNTATLSATTSATTPTWSSEAGGSTPSPGSSTVLTAVIGKAQIVPEVLGQSEAPKRVPLREASDATLSDTRSSSQLTDDGPADVPESPRSHEFQSSRTSSCATNTTSVDVRNLPFTVPLTDVPALPLQLTPPIVPASRSHANKSIPSIAIPQLPINLIPKLPNLTPLTASSSSPALTTTSSLFPVVGAAKSDPSSVTSSPRSDLLPNSGNTFSPLTSDVSPRLYVQVSEDASSAMAQCGTTFPREHYKARPSLGTTASTAQHLFVDGGQSQKSGFSILSFAPEPTTPRPFPWQAVTMEDMKARCSELELNDVVNSALDGCGGHTIHFVADDANVLNQELETCEIKGRHLLERHQSEQKRREETLKRHVIILKAFNGEEGGRFAEKLIRVITRSDRVSAELLGLIEHIDKVKEHRHAHWKAAMTVRLEKVMQERDAALMRQEELQERVIALEAERNKWLAEAKWTSASDLSAACRTSPSSPSHLIDLIQQHIQQSSGPVLNLPGQGQSPTRTPPLNASFGLITRKPQLITKRPGRPDLSPASNPSASQEFRFPNIGSGTESRSNDSREQSTVPGTGLTRSVTPLAFHRSREDLFSSPRKPPTVPTSSISNTDNGATAPAGSNHQPLKPPKDIGSVATLSQSDAQLAKSTDRRHSDRSLGLPALPNMASGGSSSSSATTRPPPSASQCLSKDVFGSDTLAPPAFPSSSVTPAWPSSTVQPQATQAPDVGITSRPTRKYQPGRPRQQPGRAKAPSPSPSFASTSVDLTSTTSGLSTPVPTPGAPGTVARTPASTPGPAPTTSSTLPLFASSGHPPLSQTLSPPRPAVRKQCSLKLGARGGALTPPPAVPLPQPQSISSVPTFSNSPASLMSATSTPSNSTPTKPTLAPIITNPSDSKSTTPSKATEITHATFSGAPTLSSVLLPNTQHTTSRKNKSRRPPSPQVLPKSVMNGRLSASANLHSIMLSQLDFMDM